jgi:hypothetical protein
VITMLTGNSRVLLTVNQNGEWNELFYPFPGQFNTCAKCASGSSTSAEESSPGSVGGTATRSTRPRTGAGTYRIPSGPGMG